jgi:hypothetical protein
MSRSFNIQYLAHHEIDKSKWDNCIDEAENGLIYGYSFYLDHMAKHWDALVLNDYKVVMPLTWNKKFSIHYLYQPAFTASLGVFGNDLTEEMVGCFIDTIPKKFKLIEISLNSSNIFSVPIGFSILRTNYYLSLNKNYKSIYESYRENHQRNVQKSLESGCVAKKNIVIEEIIELNKQQMKNIASISDDDYDRFKKLYQFLFALGKAITYGIFNSQNKLLASCVFFFSHDRAYYILVGNHPEGRNTGASHTLIDAFIKDHSGKNLILDFEGSDIESLAMFYNGFGATKETYPAIRWNRLPWYLKWLKKNNY